MTARGGDLGGLDEGQRWANREWYRIMQLKYDLEVHRCDAATMDMFHDGPADVSRATMEYIHSGLINWVWNTLGFTQTFVDMDGERDATNIFEPWVEKPTTDTIESHYMRRHLHREIVRFDISFCFFGCMPRPRREGVSVVGKSRVM